MKTISIPALFRGAVLAVVALGVLAISGMPDARAAGQQDFTLVNSTGYEISEFYVAPSKSDDWQEDVLGQDTLGDGEQANITFSRKEDTCKWDLKVVYAVDNTSAEWHSVNLCDVSTVTIKYNADTDETSAYVK